jgi:hypothetical protein
VVQDKAVLGALLKQAWTDMASALASGNKAAAMQGLSTSAQAKYGAVFDDLAPYMAQIIPTWSAPMTGSLSKEICELAIRRIVGGVKQLFFVYFIPDEYGVWRLGSM